MANNVDNEIEAIRAVLGALDPLMVPQESWLECQYFRPDPPGLEPAQLENQEAGTNPSP